MDNIAIEENLVENISLDISQQYKVYKNKVAILAKQYAQIKIEGREISNLIQQMRNENLIDNHLSKLFMLIKDNNISIKHKNNKENMNKINSYFQKVQSLSVESLKAIFEIRKFLTGQEFDIYIENKGKIFSFSIEDIEQHIGGIIPTYTDSLEDFINNMIKNSKAIAPELTKLGLTLKNMEDDLELKGINKYLEFVEYHVSKNKIPISENRKIEAAIYLYGRNENADFDNKSVRHSLHILLG